MKHPIGRFGLGWRSVNTSTSNSEELARERYESRISENDVTKRARLLYQSRKRGMLENGEILASFAGKYINILDSKELDLYDQLINLPTNDWDIYYWAIGAKPTPPEYDTSVMRKLRDHISSKVSITPWRQEQILKKFRRTLPHLTSFKSMRELDDFRVYDKEMSEVKVGCDKIPSNIMIESNHERNMKHHNFLQRLMSANFTLDPLEYDEEAAAWAEMVWHRNYGSSDPRVSISNIKCVSCNQRLQCCDYGLPGYVPKELLTNFNTCDNQATLCQVCRFSDKYAASMSLEIETAKYKEVLSKLSDEPSIVIILIDLTDFPSGILKGIKDLIGWKHRVIVVGNKLDLLPYDGEGTVDRVKKSFRSCLSDLRPGEKNLGIDEVVVLSARTGFNVNTLVGKLTSFLEVPRNIFIVGASHSGKSTLFSALLQSDLSAEREGDILGRISTYSLDGLDEKLLRFPIARFEGWEISLKKRRAEREERNFALQDYSLISGTRRRQNTMPHQSVLINCLDYPAKKLKSLGCEDSIEDSRVVTMDTLTTSETSIESSQETPNFTEDHPLRQVAKYEPISADESRFRENSFLHLTPSAPTGEQIHDLLTAEERLRVFPCETIIPRKYSIRPLKTILIGGLARLDLLTSTSNVIFTIFASKYLPINIVATRKADHVYKHFLGTPILGVPIGDQERLERWPNLRPSIPDVDVRSSGWNEGVLDIVLSSVGWALVSAGPGQDCLVRAFTPEGRGISIRHQPLLPYAKQKLRNYSLGH